MIEELYQLYLKSKGVSTDSRKISKGVIFFALKGPHFNANEFAEQAIRDGAAYCVIDQPEFKKDDRYIVVEDSLIALQELANFHRKHLKIPFIGITGSNGKTTTKELINAVLSQEYKTFATRGNLNNHIGVPLSILSIGKKVEIAIIEMGANKVGDIDELCQIAEPTHGLITNIGKAHIEGFGGFEGVLRGKTELYDFLVKNDGRVFINSGNEILRNMKKRFENPVMYPNQGDFLQCEMIEADPLVVYRHENEEVVQTNLMGKYNFENIATALCLGKYFKVPSDKANQAIKDYIPANNRSQVLKKNTNTILLDAYNANPTSMAAAIENFAQMKVKVKVLILGDMFELGKDSMMEHRQIGELIAQKNFGMILLCGKDMEAAYKAIPEAIHFSQKKELINYLQKYPIQQSHILIKASRGMAMEDLLDYL
ncbi:MAG: UDP-N-acetylmuramoyl-tripeptide--D-alanyl-D-alanine ligase [Candidatus Cyclobacteriaceae bacterium M3_2C_046]